LAKALADWRLKERSMPTLLPPITDFEAYNKNTAEQYEALGRFVVAFEAMVDEARQCSVALLTTDAPVSRLNDIAFHHPALTTKPLFEILRAIIIEYLELPHVNLSPKEKEAFRGVLKTIAAEYSELTNIRNILLHGTWFVGYSTNEDPNSENFILSKLKPTADGLAKEAAPKHAFELLALKDRCEDTRNWIAAICFCVPKAEGPYDQISEPFLFKDGAWQYRFRPDTPSVTLPRKSQ
jgi:hypothetical protein